MRLGWPIVKQNEQKRRAGARGIAKRLREEGAPKMPLIVALGSEIAVTHATVSFTMLLSVREKEIGKVAPLHP